MPRINLLPWREQRREEQQRQFLLLLGLVTLLALGLLFLADVVLGQAIDRQEARNAFIRREVTALDQRIHEINELKSRRQQLLDRMKTIQSLQGNRPVISHVFDQLVRTLPEGVYFTSLKMSGNQLAVSGLAESNNRVSSLMRHMDASDWLEAPNLTEVKAAAEGGSQFQLGVTQTRPVTTPASGESRP